MISCKLQVCLFKSQDKTKNLYNYKRLKDIILGKSSYIMQVNAQT